ncbi:hypothetical protein N7540_001747 [Penicillium herquei]|nr:hypothetical protein N7540_001747 [Penicillium herquei]
MTINHVFFWASAAKIQSLRSFYRAVLQPIGYVEMICAYENTLIGYGSDYPYFWLKQLPDGKEPLPSHIAFDAPKNMEGVAMEHQEYEKNQVANHTMQLSSMIWMETMLKLFMYQNSRSVELNLKCHILSEV